ncbi:uncharacterized protein LOC129216299 [Uloborus diversus]|uniref:uncharacterized protein LOC129216299 n=1 Tax=Uloborus diversus TaxID=327109 RepID=UPI00240A803A|nr:uncharacterized protein LOC129216299 [Uloborus diversus]
MRGFSPILLGNRRKDQKQPMSPPPDVTFIFAEDVVEWDTYLSRQFEGSGAVIQHEQVEKMTFPLPCSKSNVFSDARVVLVILSPALVAFLDTHAADSFQFTRLLKPSKTIAMLCGVSGSSIGGVKNVLISYDDWRHLEAKDKDINMVRNVIELIHDFLAKSKESERINKPKFKLVPRKVQEGNGKVYVMLAKPLENSARVKITLEANGAREVPTKKRNPYTLVFVIPDELMQAQNMVNVHVWCGEDLLGVSQVKCVTKMGELFSLLSNVISPYEFLCNTLGMATLHEVDTHVTAAFKKNLPKSGFDLLQLDAKFEKIKTKEEFPTLLHFAARHGLSQLVKELLLCPSARNACLLKNTRGLSPAQLANHAGHNDVAAAIDDFLQISHNQGKQNFETTTVLAHTPHVPDNTNCNNQSDYYDIPAHPIPVLQLPANRPIASFSNEKESDYMKMKGSHKENIEPSQNFLVDTNAGKQHEISLNAIGTAEKTKLTLLESQAKLIEIMEAYKKGASLTEVEKLHNEWKVLYQVSDIEAKSTLDGLRNLYAKVQKAKLNKKHSSSFSELRQFFNSKLRRKESIGSKNPLSRKGSKESLSEKLSTESEVLRPVSTLSVLSNTSSSSGSSFDRLSTVSAGSDSGHHSDFCDERNNKMKERFESRYHLQQRIANKNGNAFNFQKPVQNLSLSSKPPAPPPRPVKPVTHYGSLEDCKQVDIPQYAVSKKKVASSFDDTFKLLDFNSSQSKSATLSNDFRCMRRSSVSTTDFNDDDPNANYDCPPPPRTHSSLKPQVSKRSSDPKTDYDLVPPPLPVSAPPRKQDFPACDIDQSYDIPNPTAMLSPFQRSNSVSSNYDFPKTTLMDNTDTQVGCTCQMMANKNNLSSVKSCCIGNKLSSLKKMNSLPSVPTSDVIILNIEKEISNKSPKSPIENRTVHNQYYNVCLRSSREPEKDNRDSIPEEMAPPPPVIDTDSSEGHYKMVGAPIPISISTKRT